MEPADFNSEICAGEKRPRSDETTLAGGNSEKKKREKLVAIKNKPILQPRPSPEDDADEGGKGTDFVDDSGDDGSDEAPSDKEDRAQSGLEKKALITAERENFWLGKKFEPISVRQGVSAKGKSVTYLGNKEYPLDVTPFERNVTNARVFTSCIKVIRRHLPKGKNIKIVPGMICRLGGDDISMSMIHSIGLSIARPHR